MNSRNLPRRKNGRFRKTKSQAFLRLGLCTDTGVHGTDHIYFNEHKKATSKEKVIVDEVDVQECVEVQVGLDQPEQFGFDQHGGRSRLNSSWRDCRAVVDLGILFNSLVCQTCVQPLDASKCIGFSPDSLSGYVYIPCSNPLCHHVNRVPLGKEHKRVTRRTVYTPCSTSTRRRWQVSVCPTCAPLPRYGTFYVLNVHVNVPNTIWKPRPSTYTCRSLD